MAKTKIKTKKAVAKRFSVTPKGKVKGTQSNTQHRMRNRSASTLRRQRGTGPLSEHMWDKVKTWLGNK